MYQLTCVSHGPALANPLPRPPEHGDVLAAYAARAQALRDFDPELIIIFAPDHYTHIHLQLVPPFCVGMACEAVADYGGSPGRLNVPFEIACECIAWLRDHDVDVAASHQMKVDHGFSQPLQSVAGGVGRYPVLPICINTTCKPTSPFRRVRLLGEAVGSFARTLNRRIAFLASGGLSHHPANIFPQDLDGALEQVRDYLMFGGADGGMNVEEWLKYLGEQTVRGGQSVISGARTIEDFRINSTWDSAFLKLFTVGDFTVFDSWKAEDVIREAGVAAMEIQQWIAAASAAKAAGIGPIKTDLQVATLAYRIGVAVAHADAL
ncbi:MAG: hypothetical protein KGL26_04810 [Pseudomonadota bacterium]|nr:hypothetical protein [Pseudomonadota bacterium]